MKLGDEGGEGSAGQEHDRGLQRRRYNTSALEALDAKIHGP